MPTPLRKLINLDHHEGTSILESGAIKSATKHKMIALWPKTIIAKDLGDDDIFLTLEGTKHNLMSYVSPETNLEALSQQITNEFLTDSPGSYTRATLLGSGKTTERKIAVVSEMGKLGLNMHIQTIETEGLPLHVLAKKVAKDYGEKAIAGYITQICVGFHLDSPTWLQEEEKPTIDEWREKVEPRYISPMQEPAIVEQVFTEEEIEIAHEASPDLVPPSKEEIAEHRGEDALEFAERKRIGEEYGTPCPLDKDALRANAAMAKKAWPKFWKKEERSNPLERSPSLSDLRTAKPEATPSATRRLERSRSLPDLTDQSR